MSGYWLLLYVSPTLSRGHGDHCHRSSHNRNTHEMEIKGSLPLLGILVPMLSPRGFACPPPPAWLKGSVEGCRDAMFNS